MSIDLISRTLEACHLIAETHRYDLLRDKAREVLALAPGHPAALMYLCLASNNLGAYTDLEEAARDGVRLYPQEAHFYYYLYLFFLHIGGVTYIQARDAILEAIRLNPGSALYHRELGEIYLINWEPEKARKCLLDAARLNPKSGEIQSRL